MIVVQIVSPVPGVVVGIHEIDLGCGIGVWVLDGAVVAIHHVDFWLVFSITHEIIEGTAQIGSIGAASEVFAACKYACVSSAMICLLIILIFRIGAALSDLLVSTLSQIVTLLNILFLPRSRMVGICIMLDESSEIFIIENDGTHIIIEF